MPVELKDVNERKVVEIHVSGWLSTEDYEKFVPHLDQLVAHYGKVSMVIEMHDFHGWKMGALWQDTKFAIRHFHDIERLAIIGEKKWQKGMATFCKPFTKAEIRYFDHSRADEARAWVQEAPVEAR